MKYSNTNFFSVILSSSLWFVVDTLDWSVLSYKQLAQVIVFLQKLMIHLALATDILFAWVLCRLLHWLM